MKLWEIDWDDYQTRYEFDKKEWHVGDRIKDLYDTNGCGIVRSYSLEELVKADFRPINPNKKDGENKLTRIKLLNPYFDESINVGESKGQINDMMANYNAGNVPNIILTDEHGNAVSISPKNFAKVEIIEWRE